MGHERGNGGEAALAGLALAHQHQRSGTVGDRRRGGGGDGTVLHEGRTQVGDLRRVDLERALVALYHHVALAARDGDGHRFPGKAAVFIGGAGSARGFQGVGVLRFAGEVILAGAVFGKQAHRLAAAVGHLAVGVFQAVVGHVVQQRAVAIAVAGAALGNEVRGVGHAFHAAGHHHILAAGPDQVMGQHHGLHAGAAHLVERGGPGGWRKSRFQRGLPGRCLTLAGGQHAAHQHFLHLVGGDAGALDRSLDDNGPQVGGFQPRERAQHGADGGADSGYDDDRVGIHDVCLSPVSGVPGSSASGLLG